LKSCVGGLLPPGSGLPGRSGAPSWGQGRPAGAAVWRSRAASGEKFLQNRQRDGGLRPLGVFSKGSIQAVPLPHCPAVPGRLPGARGAPRERRSVVLGRFRREIPSKPPKGRRAPSTWRICQGLNSGCPLASLASPCFLCPPYPFPPCQGSLWPRPVAYVRGRTLAGRPGPALSAPVVYMACQVLAGLRAIGRCTAAPRLR